MAAGGGDASVAAGASRALDQSHRVAVGHSMPSAGTSIIGRGMTDEPDDEESRLTAELIESGSEAAGAFAGAALGSFAGPPGWALGAVGGVVVTRAFKRIGAEVQERVPTSAGAGAALSPPLSRPAPQE